MEFRILGPLEVVEGDTAIEVGGAKVRALLALLLLHPGHVVSTDRLLEGLWGDSPPATAANTLQTHVSHLRKALSQRAAGDNGQLVVTRAPGYLLAVDRAQTDVGRFEQLVEEGRRALAGGPERAAAILTEALSLWRGPALVDFTFEPFASSAIGRLEELRMTAVASRIEARLALGHHSELAGELRQLVDEHPLREQLWGYLMLALYRCGRQADALRAFSELRGILGEELGIGPSQELQRLEEAILLQKAELDWHPPSTLPDMEQRPEAVAHNLPLDLTSFVGREDELNRIDDALSRERLVTLSGPGGVGKTRLALAAGRRRVDAHGDSVFLVELAPLSDPSLVSRHALTALGLTEESRPPMETLLDHLKGRRVLLVLDNCEHLLSACAVLVDALLRACPGVRIMATSREPLHAPAETTIPVPPLPVPAVDGAVTAEAALGSDAVQLLVDRARAARPDFEITDANAPGVARVCQRLDGMPLALELAAARMRAMSPEEISDRLDDRFRLLNRGTATGPARHQTLRATVDWTYDALPAGERLLFDRLSVFAGGFDVEGAEEVCGFAPLDRAAVLDLLFALVDKSLVLADSRSSRTRYRMLETLRHYGTERLVEAGHHEEAGNRLLHWAVALAETAEPGLEGRDEALWLERLELEHDNLRAALTWALEHSEAVAGLRLAAALWRFWEVRGYLTEGRLWLERLLDVPADVPPDLRAKALTSAGVLAQRQSAYETAQALYEASLAIRRELGDQRGTAAALLGMGNLAGLQGEHGRGRALFEESLSIGRAVGEPRVVAASLTNLGWLAHEQGDFAAAYRLLQESLEGHSELRDGHGIANALHRLGALAQSQGDWASARSFYKEALRIQRELGERYGVVWSLSSLADVLEAEGDAEGAGRLLGDVLSLSRELGNKYCETLTLIRLARGAELMDDLGRADDLFKRGLSLAGRLGDNRAVGECLVGLSRVARAQGRFARAATLLAAARSIGREAGSGIPPDSAEDDDELVALREALGEASFLRAWMAGTGLDRDEATKCGTEATD